MADVRLMPLAGINTVAEDAALMRGGDSPRLHVRDAVNVDISPAGKLSLRPGMAQVSPVHYRNLWRSPLHGDLFGTLGDQWVKIEPSGWTHEALATVGEGDISHAELNNLVCVSAPIGIFTFDGVSAKRLVLGTPAAPLVLSGAGSLHAGNYGAAVAWLRGSLESATSAIAFADVGEGGALDITLPLCLDPSVTGVRLYLTRQNGGELLLAGDHSLTSPTIHIPLLPELGRAAQFRHLSPMPPGKYLGVWRGRLLVAQANVLRWSEAMAYHLHDDRHGFVQMPQRITFVQPVDGGIWVGQGDHVAFLEGNEPGNLSLQRKASKPPVPGSAITATADVAGAASQGGQAVAIWLAENGYVIGTATGQVIEPHAGALSGITGQAGTSVVLDRRVITALT